MFVHHNSNDEDDDSSSSDSDYLILDRIQQRKRDERMYAHQSSSEDDDSSDSDYLVLDRIRQRKIMEPFGTQRVPVYVFLKELQAVSNETGIPFNEEHARSTYHRYNHVASSRTWSALDIRSCTMMLKELGFHPQDPVELNTLLPASTTPPVPSANVFVWPKCGQELGIDMDRLLRTLDRTEFDKLKWSRRSPQTGGLQNKRARHNACYTDLQEPLLTAPDDGDVTTMYVRHKHPKNPLIKFTNFRFHGQLAKFRERFTNILGPFGYKFNGQFAELNKYYDDKCGIGWHGDVERGAPGSVNCLKVGRPIPLCFSWFHRSKPVSRTDSMPQPMFQPITRKGQTAWAAVLTLGHGDVYMMSEKSIGRDWKSSSLYTLRHSAGHYKYTLLSKSFYTGQLCDKKPAYSLTFSDVVENDSETPELQFTTPIVRQ